MSEIAWRVGMKVALTEGYHSTPKARTVKRLTPSGMPVIAGVTEGSERKFAKNGRERGRTGGYWGSPRIEPWTDNHDKQIAVVPTEAEQAHLIAAAPDLLEALVEFADAFDHIPLTGDFERRRAARVKALAAITKAKQPVATSKDRAHSAGTQSPPASSDVDEMVERLLIEWRDAREVIFATDQPPPEAFTRLGAAELELMKHARSLSPSTGRGG